MRVGVCGSAYWAELVHLPGFAEHPGTELVGVFGRNRERTGELAERFDVIAFDDFERMLAAVDAVSFVVPPDIQARLATAAARSGKHLMLEKPLAADFEAAATLEAAIQGAGVAAVCFLTRLFVPAVEAFLHDVRDRHPTSGSAVFRSGALLPGSPYAGSTWRQQAYGVLQDAAPHCLSVLAGAIGPVVGVAAAAPKKGAIELAIEHAGGATSTALVDLCDPTTQLTEAYRVTVDDRPVDLTWFAYDRHEAFRRAIDALLARADAGPRADQLADAMHVMAVLDAAESSLRSGGERMAVRAGV